MVGVLHRKVVVIPVVVAGFLLQLLPVTVGGLDFLMLLRKSHAQREALWLGGSNRVDFGDVWFNPNYSQLVGNWILIRYLLHMPPRPGRSDDRATVGTQLSDAISPQEWAAAARWDFIWNLRRSAKSGEAYPLAPGYTPPR
jgi:hypothetical protein